MFQSVTVDYACENGFVSPSLRRSALAKQRIVFRMMTDPHPDDEIAFTLCDCSVVNPNSGGIKCRMPF
jgi:hypothetical protein